jgi:hypothetical protein
VITRTLVDTFQTLSSRIRISPEYAYYEGFARAQARTTAAKALAAKQDERALLLYRGNANWRYKRELKQIDADIVKLREELARTEAEMPQISQEPVFGLIQANKEGTFPEAPKAGGERRFCQAQKADAFLAGAIREYYNRYYVTLRLFALYTNSFIYEDEIIFSADDINAAVDEIAGRLTAVLAASKSAAVAVHAEPPDALVLINQSFAGRGTVEAREHPPGKIEVEVLADDYQSKTVETTLVPGELTDITVNLQPRQYVEAHFLSQGEGEASVYQGAMYVGKTPLTLRLPLDQLNYISVETAEGLIGKAALAAPDNINQPASFTLRPKIVYTAADQRVEKARRA